MMAYTKEGDLCMSTTSCSNVAFYGSPQGMCIEQQVCVPVVASLA